MIRSVILFCDIDSKVIEKIMKKYVTNDEMYIWLQPTGDRQVCMKKVYSEFILGDMRACYMQDEETGSMELVLLPADMAYEVAYREKPYPDSLVQVKLSGDTYAGG